MQVFIVMIGTLSVYSYDGTVWNVARVFSNMAAALKYIIEQKNLRGSDVEYEIATEEVYA